MSGPLLKPDQVLVFEGDSLTRRQIAPLGDTWPFARINGWDRCYSEIADEWLFVNLPHLRLKSRQAAFGGSSLAAVTNRYPTHVKPLKPNWIVLTAGGNDLRQGVPLPAFADALKQYIQTAQHDSGARFLFAGGLLPMPGISDESRARMEKAQPYYDAARRVIASSGGLAPHIGQAMLRQAEALFALSPYHTFYADGTHLNALGHRVLASLVLQALGAYQMLQPLEDQAYARGSQ